MTFVGIDYIAVIVAAVAAFAVGTVWYAVFGPTWIAALGKTREQLTPGGKPPVVTMAVAFLCELLMAYLLAGVMGHLGEVTVSAGLVSASFIWLGFVATTQLVNHRYGRFPLMLTAIDAGHWLAVLLAMGAVIGAFGA